jgi:hypothetical protein
MKRYMVFAFDSYYPSGGMQDFQFSFDTKEEFEENFNDSYDYYHIFDIVEIETFGRYMKSYEIKEWVAENV